MFNRIAAACGALAVAAILPAPSSAQNYQRLRNASIEIYNTCLMTAGDIATQEGCACTAGFIGGVLTEREFDIAARLSRIGRLVESDASEDVIDAEVASFRAAGYTADEADAVSAKLQLETARGNAICSPFENNSTS